MIERILVPILYMFGAWALLGFLLKWAKRPKWISLNNILWIFWLSIPYTILYIIFYNQIETFCRIYLGIP